MEVTGEHTSEEFIADKPTTTKLDDSTPCITDDVTTHSTSPDVREDTALTNGDKEEVNEVITVPLTKRKGSVDADHRIVDSKEIETTDNKESRNNNYPLILYWIIILDNI